VEALAGRAHGRYLAHLVRCGTGVIAAFLAEGWEAAVPIAGKDVVGCAQ